MIELRCTACGETFTELFDRVKDLVDERGRPKAWEHLVTERGEFCGGAGDVVRLMRNDRIVQEWPHGFAGLLGGTGPTPRRLTKEQFIDKTLVRWGTKPYRRVTMRDGELARFVYDELRDEWLAAGFPDAGDEDDE